MREGFYYIVRRGDCLSRIARRYGLRWPTLWNHDKNRDFRDRRRDPNVIYPNDRVWIPVPDVREESGTTEERHRFRRSFDNSLLRIVIQDKNNNVMDDLRYELYLEGLDPLADTTKNGGKIEHMVRSDTPGGRLLIWFETDEDATPTEYTLEFGILEDYMTIEGVQRRLKNMGIYKGDINNNLEETTRSSIEVFQKQIGLEPTGEPDAMTKKKLRLKHDGM